MSDSTTMLIWSAAALAASIYCIVRAVIDLRQRKYAWAVLGFASAVVFLMAPIQTHAVKVDLPVAS